MNIKTVKIKNGYILRELGGEFCIFNQNDSENGSLDGLPSINETCIFLWTKIEKGYNVQQLIDAVAEHFNMEADEAEYEVAELLAKLLHGNVIETE